MKKEKSKSHIKSVLKPLPLVSLIVMNEKKDLPERSSIRPSTFVYCAKTMMYSQMRKQKEETNCARSSLFREQQRAARPSNDYCCWIRMIFFEEHDRHNAFCVTQGSTPMPNPGKRKHHDRYAEGGISCICLIAVDHLWGIERRGRSDSQEQKTTLSI